MFVKNSTDALETKSNFFVRNFHPLHKNDKMNILKFNTHQSNDHGQEFTNFIIYSSIINICS